MSSMLERINKFKERNKSTGSNNFNDNENIFFDLSEGTHRIRLVRDWVSVHSHWIAPSKFSKITLYEESAFKGENRLKRNVNCPDFDVDTEMTTEEKSCVICKIRAAANDILYSCKDLDKKQKEYLEDVAYTCAPTERIFFLCIDRDNPEISPGKNGFKIIEFPKPLFEAWAALVEDNKDFDPNSDEEGVDFIIKKEKDGKRNKYSINYVMKGTSACQTPLTDEEKNYTFHDIKKIMCKMPDQNDLYDKLDPQFQDLIKESGLGSPSESKFEKKKTSLQKNNDYSSEESIESEDIEDESVPF